LLHRSALSLRLGRRIRSFSRSTEFASFPEEVRSVVKPVSKSILINMVRDGSAQSSKVARMKQLFRGIGFSEDSDASCALSTLTTPMARLRSIWGLS